MTSSSSPGISLMCEGMSYMAGAELPCLVVDVIRGGPGLGTIQPAQGDYFQAVKGGGHGDYKIIVLAPASVQEMYDFVGLGFDLAFKYRNPVMILSDGAIGQMMEKVELREPVRRLTNQEIAEKYGHWATLGKPASRNGNIISSLSLAASEMEAINLRLQAKYQKMRENEVRFEKTCAKMQNTCWWHSEVLPVFVKAPWRKPVQKESAWDCSGPLPCSPSPKRPSRRCCRSLRASCPLN